MDDHISKECVRRYNWSQVLIFPRASSISISFSSHVVQFLFSLPHMFCAMRSNMGFESNDQSISNTQRDCLIRVGTKARCLIKCVLEELQILIEVTLSDEGESLRN